MQYTYCPTSQEVKEINQMMKFTQLIEYNIWNIFPEKSYIKYSGESIPRPFSKKKKQIWGYLRINSLKFCRVCLYCMPSWGLPKYIETELLTTWFYPFQPFLKKKKKKRTENSLPASFSAWVLKNIYLNIFY